MPLLGAGAYRHVSERRSCLGFELKSGSTPEKIRPGKRPRPCPVPAWPPGWASVSSPFLAHCQALRKPGLPFPRQGLEVASEETLAPAPSCGAHGGRRALPARAAAAFDPQDMGVCSEVGMARARQRGCCWLCHGRAGSLANSPATCSARGQAGAAGWGGGVRVQGGISVESTEVMSPGVPRALSWGKLPFWEEVQIPAFLGGGGGSGGAKRSGGF